MISINITLYGDIASYAGGNHIASQDLHLKAGSTVSHVLEALGIPPNERGYLFINAVLHDVPGLFASRESSLHDGDHIGIFSTTHMWPYQYRQGIHTSEALEKALQKHGFMHNTYRDPDKDNLTQ